jgi:hypothetical protein
VWVAKDDSSDLTRAAAIVSVGIDYNGNITARIGLSDGQAARRAPSRRLPPPGDPDHRAAI